MDFVTPQWLIAGGAVALPVVLHLIRSERFQRCELATVQLLVAVLRQRGGRRRLADWPLLLARAAALVALALLLARPFRKAAAAAVTPAAETLVLVDVSGSQARRDATDLARRVQEATAALPVEARVTGARFAEAVEVAPANAVWEPVPGAATDFSRAVEWAIDRRMQARGEPGRVVFVSDFPRAALRRLAPRLWPAGTTVALVPTGDSRAWNLGLERVELLTPGAVSAVELEVILRSSGPLPREPIRVRLESEGASAPLEQTLPAGQTRVRFRWPTTIPAEGLLWRGTARLLPPAGDAIAADDARPFAFPVTRQRAVLLVDGDPGESPFDGETYYLEHALKTVVRADEVPMFRPEVRVRLGEPAGFDAVALCNIAALSAEEVAALQRFLGAGGSLFFAPGSRTTPAVWEALAAAGIVFGKVSPARTPAHRTSTITAADHPALRPLAASEGWRQIAFWHALELAPAPGGKVLATFDGGAPLLVEAAPSPAGGRALAFLHAMDRQESEFPREPLFAPWVREVFRHLTRAAEPRWTVRAIAPSLTERRAPGVYVEGTAVTVIAPDAEEIDLTPASLEEARAALGATRVAAASPTASALAAQAPGHQRPRELWPAVAVVLFLLLLVESVLATQEPGRPRPEYPRGEGAPAP